MKDSYLASAEKLREFKTGLLKQSNPDLAGHVRVAALTSFAQFASSFSFKQEPGKGNCRL
jgi:hypothetical protein